MRLPSVPGFVLVDLQFGDGNSDGNRKRLDHQAADLQPDLLVALRAVFRNPHSWHEGADPVNVNLSWPQCDPFLLWIESLERESQQVISCGHVLHDESAELGRGNSLQFIIKEYGYPRFGLDLDVSVLCKYVFCVSILPTTSLLAW